MMCCLVDHFAIDFMNDCIACSKFTNLGCLCILFMWVYFSSLRL